jgi:hypothetical protein
MTENDNRCISSTPKANLASACCKNNDIKKQGKNNR